VNNKDLVIISIITVILVFIGGGYLLGVRFLKFDSTPLDENLVSYSESEQAETSAESPFDDASFKEYVSKTQKSSLDNPSSQGSNSIISTSIASRNTQITSSAVQVPSSQILSKEQKNYTLRGLNNTFQFSYPGTWTVTKIDSSPKGEFDTKITFSKTESNKNILPNKIIVVVKEHNSLSLDWTKKDFPIIGQAKTVGYDGLFGGGGSMSLISGKKFYHHDSYVTNLATKAQARDTYSEFKERDIYLGINMMFLYTGADKNEAFLTDFLKNIKITPFNPKVADNLTYKIFDPEGFDFSLKYPKTLAMYDLGCTIPDSKRACSWDFFRFILTRFEDEMVSKDKAFVLTEMGLNGSPYYEELGVKISQKQVVLGGRNVTAYELIQNGKLIDLSYVLTQGNVLYYFSTDEGDSVEASRGLIEAVIETLAIK